MTNPELERERGEFEKWALEEGFVRELIKMPDPLIWQSWKASQQSTLRRVRAALVANGEQQALAAIEREFGRTEEK